MCDQDARNVRAMRKVVHRETGRKPPKRLKFAPLIALLVLCGDPKPSKPRGGRTQKEVAIARRRGVKLDYRSAWTRGDLMCDSKGGGDGPLRITKGGDLPVKGRVYRNPFLGGPSGKRKVNGRKPGWMGVVDAVTWPFRLADHDPACRWRRLCEAVLP